MKFNRRHEKQLREFIEKMNENGVCPVDEWTCGSGRHTKNRALPPFVRRYERKDCPVSYTCGTLPCERVAMAFFKRNPRRKACLVLDKEALAGFLFANSLGVELC